MSNLIHPTAIIDPSAKLGENVKIGANVIIGQDVILKDNVEIKPFSTLEFCEIGKNTLVSSNSTIGSEPQDLGYKNERSKVIIGENCQIREQVTIHRSAKDGGITKVGNSCLLMVSSHVAHDCTLEDNVIMANVSMAAGHVYIEKNAFIGGLSACHQGVRIGQMAIMSGYSAIRKDIPPYAKTEADIDVLAGINTIGLKRAGLSVQERKNIKNAYKIIFYSGLNVSQGIAKVKDEIGLDNQYINYLVSFIENSKKGVLTPKRK